jgi:hypothetical protein
MTQWIISNSMNLTAMAEAAGPMFSVILGVVCLCVILGFFYAVYMMFK